MSREFTIDDRLLSIKAALRGVGLVLRSQHNAWIHAAATVAVVVLGICFGVTRVEWSCLILAVTLVWMSEAFNTALELLADAASPEFHPMVGQAKDVAAGAVLLSAVGSAVVGLLVFGPHVLRTLEAIPG